MIKSNMGLRHFISISKIDKIDNKNMSIGLENLAEILSKENPEKYPSKDILLAHFESIDKGSVLIIDNSIYSDVLAVLGISEDNWENSITRYDDNNQKINSTIENKPMTVEKLKNEFPEVFNQIFTAGMQAGKQSSNHTMSKKNDEIYSSENAKELEEIDAAIDEHFKNE